MLVKDLLQLPSLKSSKLVSGISGLDKEVVDIIVMEAPDIESWSIPGQVLMTSMYNFSMSPQEQWTFISKLSAHQISALIIKTDRFIKNIPETFIEASEFFKLPIIQIENHVKYNTIIIDVMQSLFNTKVKRLDYYREVHNYLISLTLKRSDIKEILTVFSGLVNNPVTFYKDDSNVFTSHDYVLDMVPNGQQEKEDHLQMQFPYFFRNATYPQLGNGIYRQVIVPIEVEQISKSTLLIHEINRSVKDLDFMALENIVTFIQMEQLRDFAVTEVRQKYKDDIFDDLLNGRYSTNEQITENARILGLSIEKSYRIITWRLFKMSKDYIEHNEIRLAWNVAQQVQRYNLNMIYKIRTNSIVFIADTDLNDEEVKKIIQQVFSAVADIYKEKQIKVQVGISSPVTLDTLSSEYNKSLKIIDHSILFGEENFVHCYRDIGIYQLLAMAKSKEQLLELVPQKLKKLEKKELLITLKTYLDHNQKLKETAEALFVHYKTVSYRLEKIKQITEIRFNNPEEILQVNIGLRILHILEKDHLSFWDKN
ncbi:PucR family transcriptional regulator [Bacillus sp. 1P06AnD]|uniref:PucR family transcriptional regulator n=1 Tax=Bacillus sp. 1P06AnD TaxID=3132208 RepID=UPI0039A2AF27